MIITIPVTTTGADGSATGSATSERYRGIIEAISVDYAATAPNTTDVTITLDGAIAQTIGNLANSATDATFYPAKQLTDNTGAGVSVYGLFFADWQTITVSVDDSNALTNCVVVTISMRDEV